MCVDQRNSKEVYAKREFKLRFTNKNIKPGCAKYINFNIISDYKNK